MSTPSAILSSLSLDDSLNLDMCQTDVFLAKPHGKPALMHRRIINDRRLFATRVETPLNFGEDDKTLLDDSTRRNPARPCPKLVAPSSGAALSPDYIKKTFGPWLESSLNSLSINHRSFTGPDRSRLMFQYLQEGCADISCPRFQQKLLDAGNASSLSDMLQDLKLSMGYSSRMKEEHELLHLLSWKGCFRGGDMWISFNDFLDRYVKVDKDVVKGHDAALILSLRAFARQSNALACLPYLNHLNFFSQGGELISEAPRRGESINHTRWLCLIQSGLEDRRALFGIDDSCVCDADTHRKREDESSHPYKSQNNHSYNSNNNNNGNSNFHSHHLNNNNKNRGNGRALRVVPPSSLQLDD